MLTSEALDKFAIVARNSMRFRYLGFRSQGYRQRFLRLNGPNTSTRLFFLIGVAALVAVTALVLTHLLWEFVQHTPFLLGFAATIFASAWAGRTAGFLARIIHQ